MRWIIGDIHGMLKPLATLLEQIPRLDSEAVFYFVGDYVNRGPQSREVIDLLLTLKNARFIRGNHDDVLDQILSGQCYGENASRGDRFLAFQWFLDHGLYETLVSYGVTRELIARVIGRRPDALQVMIDCFPVEHRNFIRTLPLYFEDHDLFLIHGKWSLKEKSTPTAVIGDGTKIPAIVRQESLWGRFTDLELKRDPSWPKRGFFGHTPVQTYENHEADSMPIIAVKIALIDTAAALVTTGRLTAVCAETMQIIQSDPKGNLVPQD